MSKTLDVNYYKIEVNHEGKETKCTHMVICEISILIHVEIEKNHKVQYDFDNIFFYRNIYSLIQSKI
jgi:hypothetical protein